MSRSEQGSHKSKKLPRGIAPDLLLSQVKNTMPWLFDAEIPAELEAYPPARVFRDFARNPHASLSHFEYFRLCYCAHMATVATPVPTDVDRQIRHGLWPEALPADVALEMTKLVLESQNWDYGQVTGRLIHGLSGHLGEWFTVATGAYCALARYLEPELRAARQALFDAIAEVTNQHSEVFGSLMRAGEGIDALKVSAAIAHNFGDMDRVMDMWDLPLFDPLRLKFYKLGIAPFDSEKKLRYLGRLWVAGELYKSPIESSSMAMENHRHFALRKPKCLRKIRALLVVTGPFFDAWGRRVGEFFRHPDGSATEELMEVVDALQQGWTRLPGSLGYGRALRGIREAHPKVDIGRAKIFEIPEERFENTWAKAAIKLMDEIPSRA